MSQHEQFGLGPSALRFLSGVSRPNGAWLLASVLLWETGLHAATLVPYEVVVLDSANRSIVTVDMEDGTETVTPIAREYGDFAAAAIATDSYGSVFALSPTGLPLLAGVAVARLDPQTRQWEVMPLDGWLGMPSDMDITRDGRIIVSSGRGIFELDQETGMIHGDAPEMRAGGLVKLPVFDFGVRRKVEIDSSGAFITNDQSSGPERRGMVTPLFRQAPGAGVAERIGAELWLDDYVLLSDTTLIGVGRPSVQPNQPPGRVYQIDLATGSSEVLLEDENIGFGTQVEIDPNGRIVLLNRRPTDGGPAQLMRLDLTAGTTDVVTLHQVRQPWDMEILLIPEPATWVLLATGLLAILVTRAAWRGRPKDRLRNNGCSHGSRNRQVLACVGKGRTLASSATTVISW